MKKMVAGVLLALLALTLPACGARPGSRPDAGPTEIIVFAAASMTETLTEIGQRYMEENDRVTVRFNFDSSGTLKTQIEEGADCDVFISAGQKQMEQLEELSLVDTESRFDILENKVALCIATNSDCGAASFDELMAALAAGRVKLAMGNSDVPVGQYTQKILAYYGLDELALAEDGLISYGSNVKEVTTQLAEGTVDCGIIYATDAFSAGLEVADTATAEMCGQVIYPAALLTDAAPAAADFLAYLKSAEAARVFESVGFTPLAQ